MEEKKKAVDKWLEVAYELFAELGPEAINVKILSEASELPRTNFYYHFADKEDLIERLLQLHVETQAARYRAFLEEEFEKFIPDLYCFLAQNKKAVRFHWQLFKHREDFRYNQVYLLNRSRNSELILPRILEYYKIDLPIYLIQSIWDTVNDAWTAQLDFNDFTVETLSKSADKIMRSVLAFARHQV